MLDNFEEPSGYIKIEKLSVGSNLLLNGTHIISAGGHVPIIVGKGPVPSIWISARANGKWVELVINNVSTHPRIRIVANLQQREIIIRTEKETVLKAKMIDEDQCLISEINLRPTGLDLVANQTELRIGGSKFSNNEFSGARFMISFE